MPIPDGVIANYHTLLRAAANGDLALVECTDAKTGEPRYVLCGMGFNGKEYIVSPFGHMCAEGNPFEVYVPPFEKDSKKIVTGKGDY